MSTPGGRASLVDALEFQVLEFTGRERFDAMGLLCLERKDQDHDRSKPPPNSGAGVKQLSGRPDQAAIIFDRPNSRASGSAGAFFLNCPGSLR